MVKRCGKKANCYYFRSYIFLIILLWRRYNVPKKRRLEKRTLHSPLRNQDLISRTKIKWFNWGLSDRAKSKMLSFFRPGLPIIVCLIAHWFTLLDLCLSIKQQSDRTTEKNDWHTNKGIMKFRFFFCYRMIGNFRLRYINYNNINCFDFV